MIAFGTAREDISNDPVFQLVKQNSEVAPDVLKEHGKVRRSDRRILPAMLAEADMTFLLAD